MARTKPTVFSKYFQTVKAVASKHKVATNVVGVIATLCFLGLFFWLIIFLATVHDEGERITAVHHEIQIAKAGLKQQLGSALTDIEEEDSCYHMYQSVAPAPPIVPNGVLFCGMNLQGATYNWNNGLVGGDTQWGTILYVNEAILNTFSLDGITPTLDGNKSSEPENGQPISFQNSFTLYDGRERCDILADTRYNDVNYSNIKHDLPGQIYFSLNCYQKSSINFFTFVPSGLD